MIVSDDSSNPAIVSDHMETRLNTLSFGFVFCDAEHAQRPTLSADTTVFTKTICMRLHLDSLLRALSH